MPLRALIADVETTGADKDDRVCEVAWIEVDENLAVLDRQHSLIDPQRPISATASGIHGITNVDVAESPTMEEFFGVILSGKYFAADDEVLLIAHNSIFDRRFLSPHMPIVAELCTLRLARRTWPEAENHKLATLMYLFNLERGKSHSADGDVETTFDLLCKIVAATGKNLQTLIHEAVEPVWVNSMPFGKHKGKPLKDLPSTYIAWLLGLDNLDSDTRWSLNKVNSDRLARIRA